MLRPSIRAMMKLASWRDDADVAGRTAVPGRDCRDARPCRDWPVHEREEQALGVQGRDPDLESAMVK
jgi:hypothetical protein